MLVVLLLLLRLRGATGSRRRCWCYSATLVVLALTTSGYFGSKPRYLLPAFGLLLPLAVRLARVRPAVR